MTYYKIIKDGMAVDAGFTFLRWDDRHGRLMGCDAQEAHFIQSGDGHTVYRAGWLNPVPDTVKGRFETVVAAIIDRQEYEDLRAVLDSGETVPEPTEEETLPDETPAETEETESEKPMTVQQMREKIAAQEASIAMLTECLLEMSEIVYGE